MKQKLTLLLIALLTCAGARAQLTSITDGSIVTWKFQRVDNGASEWISSDFKNSGVTESKAGVFQFELAEEPNTYYIKNYPTGNYIYASATTKSSSKTDSRMALGTSTLPVTTSGEQVENLNAYKWVVNFNSTVDGKGYGTNVFDIEPSQNTSLSLALWTQTPASDNNIILYDKGYIIAYFQFYQPSVGSLISAGCTYGQIKANGYSSTDIAEYYKPTKLDVVGWPTTTAYNTFKTAIDALNDDAVVSTAYETPYNTMCTTVLLPEVGKFYTIYQPIANKYIHAVTPDNLTNLAASTDGTAADAIFYVPFSGRFLSYTKGYAMSTNKIYNGYYGSGGYQTYTIDHYSAHPLGTLRIKGRDYYLAADAGSDYVWTSSYGGETSKYWLFTEVTSLPITMNLASGAYYATINLPVAVEIPSELSAYSATADGTTLSLTKVVENGVLAASQPVILYSEAPVTSLTISGASGENAGSNELRGTTAAASVTSGENYVLSANGSGNVGFYLYNNTEMPGFKAYLPASAKSSGVKAFTFSFEDVEDAIRAIESENSGLEIYDIVGRRVQKAQKGLYIVNGKKVMYN